MSAGASSTPSMETRRARDALDLSPLFAPRSVALVGASDQGERFGTRVYRQLINFGFRGAIDPVNPRAREGQTIDQGTAAGLGRAGGSLSVSARP